MKLEDARALAERARTLVAPYVRRVEIAGSIRREKPEVKDIELVAEMRMEHDMFGDRTRPPYANAEEIKMQFLRSGAECYKSGMRYAQFQTIFGEPIKLDLFMVWPPRQWGAIFMIRTGSADFSEYMMRRLLMRGYRCQEGQVRKLGTGEFIETPEERDMFRLAGISFREPEARFA